MLILKKNKVFSSRSPLKKAGIITIISGILSFIFVFFPAFAQTELTVNLDQPLKVATRVLPPFVIEKNGELSGFSIDLWHNITAQLGVKSEFKKYPNIKELLKAVEKHQVDLGIAAISITAEREQKFDFSYPIFFSGLQILVRNNNAGSSNALQNLISSGSILFSTAIAQILGIGALLSAIIAHIIWFVERNHKESMVSRHYFPGIFEAFWGAITTLVTQKDWTPSHVLAKIVALFWMFSSVIFLSYFTASFTSIMTVQRLQTNIKGPDDLRGNLIATTRGSVAAEFLKKHHLETLEFSNIEKVYDSLINKKVDAVVFDSPVLKYYSNNEGRNKVQLIGEIFDPTNYGIVYPQKTPLRKAVNIALLKLYANGTYQEIHDKYFKKSNESHEE